MFVGIGLVVPDNRNINQEQWADNSASIARAIQNHVGGFRVLVDGTDKTAAVTMPVGEFDGVAIVAKDKTTLLRGLKIVKAGARISAVDGNLGYAAGSYDREKVGAWLKTKLQAKKTTGNYNAFDRERLDDRAYFVIVTRAINLANNHKSVNLHQGEIQLNALPGLLSGKMTRDEAVENLFQDLLVA